MNILFRCDGSVEIGMGHVVRCLALANELKDKYDCNITFAMRKLDLGNKKVLESFSVITANSEDIKLNYVDWLTKSILDTKTEILILDVRDGLLSSDLKKIKIETGVKLVTIDDPEEKRLEVDLAFYPPVPQVKEMNWTNFKGKLYSDWKYVILRKEFLNSISSPENDFTNIFVSMGATDPKNMTNLVVDSLNNISYPFHVNIVIGEGYMFRDELIEKLENISFDYDLLINPRNIAKVMSKSNFAVISFGQTAYELTCLGVPAIHVCLSEDHKKSSSLFEQTGVGMTAGIYNQISQDDLSNKILLLLEKKKLLNKMKSKADSIVISGVEEISKLILKLNK